MTQKFDNPNLPLAQPPQPPKSSLPTMYELPSEDPKEPGLPDEFHLFQSQLLRETFRPPAYSVEEIFIAADLNVYFDPDNTLWHKRPDWFAVLGVSRLYHGTELRLSYVVWDEQLTLFIIVELLSEGTAKENLGLSVNEPGEPPTKWQVYEQYLRVPYYAVFDRFTDRLRIFHLASDADQYVEIKVDEQRCLLPEIGLQLGLWHGEYQGVERLWLRWVDEQGNWLATPLELERQCVEEERLKSERLAARLRALGEDPDNI